MALRDNLELYLRFRCGCYDDVSGNGRNMVEVGTATTISVLGKLDAAADFTGAIDNYLWRGTGVDDAVFDFGSGNFTIALWVKFDTLTGEQILIEKFLNRTGPGWTLYKMSPATQQLEFYGDGLGGPILTTGNAVSASTWHHVVVRRSGNNFSLWVDGSSAATGSSAASINNTSEPLRIGHREESDGRDFPLNGQVDECAIWSRAISDSEIGQVYNSGNGKYLMDPTIGQVDSVCEGATIGRAGFAIGTTGWFQCVGDP